MFRYRSLRWLIPALLFIAGIAGCAGIDQTGAGTAAEQLTTFAGDFLRELLAAFLT